MHKIEKEYSDEQELKKKINQLVVKVAKKYIKKKSLYLPKTILG